MASPEGTDITTAQWPPLQMEVLPWRRDAEQLALIPKSRRRKILPEYEAVIPLSIAERPLILPQALLVRLEDLTAQLVRFDQESIQRSYDLPSLLLRSESASSSQIENLTSSIRNIALAEISDKAPRNALVIAHNLEAMRAALAVDSDLDREGILRVYRALTGDGDDDFRHEQVWIGGTAYSPHGALFVPPRYDRVEGCLEDACAFAMRDDLPVLAKAAIFHAQFETIHPFIDGNGRTGRTLLHQILKREGLLQVAALPISAGLLHDIDAYMGALDAYHEGDPLQIIRCVANALEIALVIGGMVYKQVDEVLSEWEERLHERAGSVILGLPELLVQHPVVNASLVAQLLQITPRAARDVISRAMSYGMLRQIGSARRNVFYQADELIEILDEVASLQGVRRMLSGR